MADSAKEPQYPTEDGAEFVVWQGRVVKEVLGFGGPGKMVNGEKHYDCVCDDGGTYAVPAHYFEPAGEKVDEQ